MAYAFNEDKSKAPVFPKPNYNVMDASLISNFYFDGEVSKNYTVPKDGYVWVDIDNSVSVDPMPVVFNGGAMCLQLKVNNQSIGLFYGGSDCLRWATPAFPVKAGDVVTLTNFYPNSKIFMGIRGIAI